SAVHGAGRLRRPWLRPAAPPISSVSGATMETKERLMRTAIPSNFGVFVNKPVRVALRNTPTPS
ncbi:MAG: hypothetical protein WC834_04065, partial [Eubacteriales bacterium]